jgi:hypothetical protein
MRHHNASSPNNGHQNQFHLKYMAMEIESLYFTEKKDY